jgi:hypothetical protein
MLHRPNRFSEAEHLFGEKASKPLPMIDTRTRSIFPDIETFQCGSSLQGRSIGEVQNSVLVQESIDHLHILGISHTIHLVGKKEGFVLAACHHLLKRLFFANLMNPLLSILDFLQSDIALLGTHFKEY